MELKDHREEGRSEPQGRGKSRREERDDGPVEERARAHAQRPRGRRILYMYVHIHIYHIISYLVDLLDLPAHSGTGRSRK